MAQHIWESLVTLIQLTQSILQNHTVSVSHGTAGCVLVGFKHSVPQMNTGEQQSLARLSTTWSRYFPRKSSEQFPPFPVERY